MTNNNQKHNILDKLSYYGGQFLTSTLLIIIVMLAFLIGIALHLIDVFDSVWLAVGMQMVVLISSTNSNILPAITVSKEYVAATKEVPGHYVTKTLSVIPLVMSILMCWYIFVSMSGLTAVDFGITFWLPMTKAIGISATEYMFAYLFTSRFEHFKAELSAKHSITIAQSTVNTEVVNTTEIKAAEINNYDNTLVNLLDDIQQSSANG